MKLASSERLELNRDESGLLFWNVANEVVHGIRVDDFERTIGASKKQVEAIADELRAAPKDLPIIIDRSRARILRNALAVVVRELGVEEFHPRTGYDFEPGRQVLQELNQFVGEDSPEARS
jgi:hypothetical protein